MARQERYTIGPNLLRDIRSTIQKVDALAPHTSGPTQGVRYWDMQRPVRSAATDVFRICTFTGSWAIDSAKSVKFAYESATPNTISVQNVLFPLPELSSSTASPTFCAIGKDGTAWYLVNVVHSGHDILTGASLTPSNLQFTRRNGMSISATAATAAISASSCDNKVSAAQLSSFLG